MPPYPYLYTQLQQKLDKANNKIKELEDQLAEKETTYPTVWAYEQACAALETWKNRALIAEAALEAKNKFHRCNCLMGRRNLPHKTYCREYVGPLEHKWINKSYNVTFGGIDYFCACGGSFRFGGWAGAGGDGTEKAEPICPNINQTWRGPQLEQTTDPENDSNFTVQNNNITLTFDVKPTNNTILKFPNTSSNQAYIKREESDT